ncbi:phosphoenolpyruvate carboxylase, partial [Patescibacteria group bacterium]
MTKSLSKNALSVILQNEITSLIQLTVRKIPATMATQHPDNAGPAYFSGSEFLSVKDEIEECYRCFSELGVQEYMWDWEGKFVDEAVIDRLYNHYHDYFQKNQIGKDIFLTFRIPNIWLESSHKLPRAFMNMITAENAAKTYKFHSPPLFEVILPMCTSSKQMIYIQKSFSKISKATEEIFEMKTDLKHIEVIPLFEEFEVIANSKKILKEYINFLKKQYNHKPEYLRIFTARSDPAMNAGLLPAKLAAKQSISLYHEFGEENGIKIYPWIGGGSLPFRGGINPENIKPAIEEFSGVGTLTVQSAFRYDYDMKQVKKAINMLNKEIPKRQKKYEKLSAAENKLINDYNKKVSKFFRKTIESIAGIINQIAEKLPSHRERMQHIGLFGYSRGIGKVKLPRAIKFTGALYSIGVPPELIGSGRALKLAQKMGIM